MDIKKIRKELKSRSIWAKLLNELILRAVLVKNGTKRNATMGYLKKNGVDLKALEQLLDFLNLEYIFSEKTGNLKVIMGLDPREVEEIYEMQESIFIGDRSKEESFRYGVLMGYPECCCKRKVEADSSRWKNDLGYHYYRHNPWPWQLSFIEPIVYHVPCSSNCKDSIEIGEEASRVRKKIFPRDLSRSYPEIIHPSYVLSFAANLYVCFTGEEQDKEIKITKIFRKDLNPHKEYTETFHDLERETTFVRKIEKGDALIFEDDGIAIEKINQNSEKKKEFYEKKSKSRGVLIRFVI